MGQVTVLIGGRNYPLACRDGEEAHLIELAGMIESKTGELTTSLGAMSEPRMLLMAGLLIADELFENRKHRTVPAAQPAPAADANRLIAVARRLEKLAESLEPASPELEVIDAA